MRRPVAVRQDETKPVPVEVLAESIRHISEGVRKLRAGPLNDKALLLLIHHSTGVAQRDIKAVLDGIESLDTAYLRKAR